MKKVLKKTMSVLLTLCMLLSIFTVCAFAEADKTADGTGVLITNVDVQPSETTTGVYDATVSFTATEAGQDLTLLTYQGSGDPALDVDESEDTFTAYASGMQIVAIDQKSIESTTGTFTFSLDTRAKIGEADNTGIVTALDSPILFVVGGEKVTKPAAALFTIAGATQNEIALISFDSPESVFYILKRTEKVNAKKYKFEDVDAVVAAAVKATLIDKTVTLYDGAETPNTIGTVTLTDSNFEITAVVDDTLGGWNRDKTEEVETFHTSATYSIKLKGLDTTLYTTAEYTYAVPAPIALDENFYGDVDHTGPILTPDDVDMAWEFSLTKGAKQDQSDLTFKLAAVNEDDNAYVNPTDIDEIFDVSAKVQPLFRIEEEALED